MINIVRIALKTLAFKAKAFEDSTKIPMVSQKRTLLEYLYRNKFTEYGIKYNFSAIKSVEEYQKSVPINDWRPFDPMLSGWRKANRVYLLR